MHALTEAVVAELRRAAVPADAAPMEAYLKGIQPFLGVKRPARKPAEQLLKRSKLDAATLVSVAEELWDLPFREGRYCALTLLRRRDLVGLQHLPLYERLVREGAWWDLVDELASHLVGPVLLAVGRLDVLDGWIDDEDLWIRRTALIAQLRSKERTDWDRLQRYCLARADETDFFIRKAIGWSLRQYARTAPERVRTFLDAHGDALSGLSYREAARALG